MNRKNKGLNSKSSGKAILVIKTLGNQALQRKYLFIDNNFKKFPLKLLQ